MDEKAGVFRGARNAAGAIMHKEGKPSDHGGALQLADNRRHGSSQETKVSLPESHRLSRIAARDERLNNPRQIWSSHVTGCETKQRSFPFEIRHRFPIREPFAKIIIARNDY